MPASPGIPRPLSVLVLLTLLVPEAAQAAEVEGLFRLEGQTTVPGSSITVPFFLSGNLRVGGFALSVDFDEEVLQVEDVIAVWERPSGEPWDFYAAEFNNLNEFPGNDGVDEGALLAAAVFSFVDADDAIPAVQEVHVLDLTLTVLPEASPGETTLSIVDGARQAEGVAVENVVAMWDTDSSVIGGPPDVEVTPVFIHALLSIVESRGFLRGDSNRDGVVDLSDALATLNYLFTDGPQPGCMDAADANDDGFVDMSDSITTLMFLFLGGSLPPPVNEPGEDLTEDSLHCSA